MEFNWDIGPVTQKRIERIIFKYREFLQDSRDDADIAMDLIAVHKNGCPLNFPKMAKTKDIVSLVHDIVWIRNNLDRETGKLKNNFVPRFAK